MHFSSREYRLDVPDSAASFRACGTTQPLVAATSSEESSPTLSIVGVRMGTINKKGKLTTNPDLGGYLTIQEFEEFVDELDELARARREQFGKTSYDNDVWTIPIANQELQEDISSDLWVIQEPTVRMYNSFRAVRGHQDPPTDCADEEEWWMDMGRQYFETATLTFKRTPFLTDNGYLGMGPRYLQEGDIVVIFLGAGLPHIIREAESGLYELVGEAYVQGVMQGEFMESEPKPETFILR